MVHYGKHIIDPETGLCEICDRGAIHDFHQGKRPGRQFLYSNQDGKFTYRSADDEIRHNNDEATPRYVRKPLYPEPPPRPRPVVQEPVVVKKKIPRRNYSPVDDIQHPPPPRPTTFYYVDNTGQMIPRNEAPPDEPRRRYIVQSDHSPPARPTRVVQRRAETPPRRPTRVTQRRAQTPPPPASESWRSRPKQQTNSDTVMTQEPYRTKPHEVYHSQSPRRPEMYYIERPNHENRFTTISSQVQSSHDNNFPPSKVPYQGDTNRKQRQLEPIERQHYTEPEPTVVRKVYKKLPANKSEHPQDEYIPNGHHARPVRKVEKIYPSPRTYESSPQPTNRQIRSPLTNKNPSIYYIQSVDGY